MRRQIKFFFFKPSMYEILEGRTDHFHDSFKLTCFNMNIKMLYLYMFTYIYFSTLKKWYLN